MAMPCSEDWQQEEEQGWSMPDDHSFSDVIYVSDLWINGQKWDPLQGQVSKSDTDKELRLQHCRQCCRY